MNKQLILITILISSFCIISKQVECQTKQKSADKKIVKKYIPQLGDIGDLFGGGPVGDPPVCSSFEDIDKWNKYAKTNDEKIIEGIDVGIFFLSTGDKIRITDFKESKWGKCIEFRVMNGENQGKLAWGRVSDFRLIKSKIKQDKEANERGE
jgi:hypothetical protein